MNRRKEDSMPGSAVQEEGAPDGRLSIWVDEVLVPGATIFRLEGRLDIFTYLQLKRAMEPRLEQAACKFWLVDLHGVNFVASSGWAVFLAIRARQQRENCGLALFGLAPNLARIHQSMNMGKLVPAYPDLAQARSAIGL